VVVTAPPADAAEIPRAKAKPKIIAAVPPDAPALQPNSGPRFGQQNPHKLRAMDLDRVEYYFASDCELPSSLPKPSLPGPPVIDWGKVTRGPVDVIATLDTGAERDMRLYEVAGARGTYVFNAREANLAGDLDAVPGDLVALCPEKPDHWQLPGEWSKAPLMYVRFAAKVAGPPDLAHLPYVAPGAGARAPKKPEWPYPDRFITYVHDPRLTSDGKYYVGQWYFEVDEGKPALPKHYNALMIADHPRFEERDGRTVTVVHAVEFRDHIFPR
jgi:hypothetical protein